VVVPADGDSSLELSEGPPRLGRKFASGQSLSDSLDLCEPGAEEVEEPAGQPRHCFNHSLPPSDPIEMAPRPLKRLSRRPKLGGISRREERQDGRHEGALPAILAGELIVDISDCAPSLPEVGARGQGWDKPLPCFVHPPAVDIT
jgi:hypothetical protein